MYFLDNPYTINIKKLLLGKMKLNNTFYVIAIYTNRQITNKSIIKIVLKEKILNYYRF